MFSKASEYQNTGPDSQAVFSVPRVFDCLNLLCCCGAAAWPRDISKMKPCQECSGTLITSLQHAYALPDSLILAEPG